MVMASSETKEMTAAWFKQELEKELSVLRARRRVESLRKNKFSIGENRANPLTPDLHQAVAGLSAELYAKDVHFLMELIQNAEDNAYLAGTEPTLELVLTKRDICGCGAPATLFVFNNEVGFSSENMDSICSVGRSTKKGKRSQGFIGEKGIGFKSVFVVSGQPHIFSNGYQVRFDESPKQDCGVGYIVPEWVDDKPTIKDIQKVYGEGRTMPNTTIILPLKSGKVETVKKELSEVHPEVLLFLSKIKRLIVRENSSDSSLVQSVSVIAMSSETSLVSLKTQVADARIVTLSAQEGANSTEATCKYFIWSQEFPVAPGSMVAERINMKEQKISLAFPFGQRLKRGISSVGIFAFLPTAMVTNFPFIVQADFMLASSRETILLDNKWNLGILDNVSSTFVHAMVYCVNSIETGTWFSISQILKFMPTQEPPCKQLNSIRHSIKAKLQKEQIILCDPFSNETRLFCEPTKATRIFPEFREILSLLKGHISSEAMPNMGTYILHSTMDLNEYDEALTFLGVPSAQENCSWYAKCIKSCDIVSKVSCDTHMKLLHFVAKRWSLLKHGKIKDIPLLRYAYHRNKVISCSISQVERRKQRLRFVLDAQRHSWLNAWNVKFGCPEKTFFLPVETVKALTVHPYKELLRSWLTFEAGIVETSIWTYYHQDIKTYIAKTSDPKIAVLLACFLYDSTLKGHLNLRNIQPYLCALPIVDESGKVHASWDKMLVPPSSSKWLKLFGGNPFAEECRSHKKYVELGRVYGSCTLFANRGETELSDFLIEHTGALDLPDIPPLNSELKVAQTELTNDQVMLLLEWVHCIRVKGHWLPPLFIESIRKGGWMKTYSGYCPPVTCFFCDETEDFTLLFPVMLQLFNVLDEKFYMNRIRSYKDELQFIGVHMGSDHLCQLVINQVQEQDSFTLSRDWALFLLQFLRHLKMNRKISEDLIVAARKGEWLKTNQGYCSPAGSVFPTYDVDAFSQICNLFVIDKEFYGREIESFFDELQLMGVVVDLDGVFDLMPGKLNFVGDLSSLRRDSILLLLKCAMRLGAGSLGCDLMQKLVTQSWLRTSLGFRQPSESILSDKKFASLLKVISLPIIEEAFYGSEFRLYKTLLKAIGVIVDFDGVFGMFYNQVKSLLSSRSLTKSDVLNTLHYLKCYSNMSSSQLQELKKLLSEEEWLNTSQGLKSASDSVLFDSKWNALSHYVDIPMIDVAFYGLNILSYKDQLKMLGVVVEFDEGSHFVAKGLRLPKEPAYVAADTALSLVQCVNRLRKSSSDQLMLEELLSKLKGSKWVKTYLGYRSPEQSLLFDPEWQSCLERSDAPFIDESFYGGFGSVDRDDLKTIGIKVSAEDALLQVHEILHLHTQTCSIIRIYKFLNRLRWHPKKEELSYQLWIPDRNSAGGQWVDSRVCVLHDKANLFSSRLYALDSYYEDQLLSFLQSAFGVPESPSVDDYLTLWHDWARCNRELSLSECISFWESISEKWNSTTEEMFIRSITVVPVNTDTASIQMVEKSEVFIPNDLHLKKLFMEVSVRPLFVWSPQKDTSSLCQTRLFEMYATLGVKKISECVQVGLGSMQNLKLEEIDSSSELIGKPLIKIILAFLASRSVNMEVEERHKIAKTLLDVSVILTGKQIDLCYYLQLPSSEVILRAKARKLVVWDKSTDRLIVSGLSWDERKNNIVFVTDFARAISEGLLTSNSGWLDSLCKLIQIGFLCGFQEDAVNFLLMTEHLALSTADMDFLSASFPPSTDHLCSPVSKKRHSDGAEMISTPEIVKPRKSIKM